MTSLDIAGGRVLDPAQEIDATATVHIGGGEIGAIAIGPPGTSEADDRDVIDASGLLVTPGLIDLHTHLFTGVSHYGVEADAHCLSRGVTTAIDAGSAGAQTFPALRRYVIEPSDTRILAFLHIAVQGMITSLVGELEDIRWASPQQAIARAREHADLIVGIKVRLGYQMVGNDPAPALRLARLRAREQERYGAAIAPGGPLHAKYEAFIAWAARYDEAEPVERSRALHEHWLAGLPCPVVRLDGAASIEANVATLARTLAGA